MVNFDKVKKTLENMLIYLGRQRAILLLYTLLAIFFVMSAVPFLIYKMLSFDFAEMLTLTQR